MISKVRQLSVKKTSWDDALNYHSTPPHFYTIDYKNVVNRG